MSARRQKLHPLPPGAERPFRGLPVAIDSNGPDGFTLTDLRTGQRRAYAIARPVCKCTPKTRKRASPGAETPPDDRDALMKAARKVIRTVDDGYIGHALICNQMAVRCNCGITDLRTALAPAPETPADPPCDHKFVDSTRCVKCGWTPADPPRSGFVSCECPAGTGQPCPLTFEACEARVALRRRTPSPEAPTGEPT